MEAMLGWIGDVFRFLLSLIPRLLIVRATHAGVKFVRGKHVRPLLPGLHLYWPLVTETDVVPVRRQTTNLVTQYVITSDGVRVGVGGIVVYEVSEPVKLLTACWDYEETIRDISLAAIKRVVSEHEFEFFRTSGRKADQLLTKRLRPDLEHFGVRTIRVTLSDFCECMVLGTWGLAAVQSVRGVTSET